MDKSKKKPKILNIIAIAFFAVCIVLHIIVNIKFQPINVEGIGYYIACLLFIIYAVRPVKYFASISAVLICVESILSSCSLYEYAQYRTAYINENTDLIVDDSSVAIFEKFFELYEGRYLLAIMLFFALFILEILFVKTNKASIFSKTYPYIITILGLLMIGFSAFELLNPNCEHYCLYIEPEIIDPIFAYFQKNEVVLSLLHMISLFIGVTLLSASHCKIPKIKQLSNNAMYDTTDSSYESAKKLKEYHDLFNQGIITQEEYEQKKDELLK